MQKTTLSLCSFKTIYKMLEQKIKKRIITCAFIWCSMRSITKIFNDLNVLMQFLSPQVHLNLNYWDFISLLF